MSINGRPERVHRARVTGDSEAARIMGSHGAAKAAENRKKRLAQEVHDLRKQQEKAALEEYDRMLASNEHLSPPPSAYGD